jgi:DNA-binding transcriptional LysR family regulator
MDLDPRRLTVLALVHRTGGVLAAAQALHVTPSAVSQQLARLEVEAGSELLVRTGRRLVLTQPGVALAERGERIAAELVAAQHDLAVLTGRVSGRVTVVAFATVIAAVVGPAAALAHDRLPAVDLRVLEVVEQDALPRLRGGDVDVVIIERDAADPPRAAPTYASDVMLLEDPYVLMSPSDRPVPRTAAELARTGWIVGFPGSTTRSVLERFARGGGWVPTIAHEAVESSAMLALTAAGLGCSPITRLALPDPSSALGMALTATPVAELGARRLVARHRSGRHEPAPAVRAVVQLMAEVASSRYPAGGRYPAG